MNQVKSEQSTSFSKAARCLELLGTQLALIQFCMILWSLFGFWILRSSLNHLVDLSTVSYSEPVVLFQVIKNIPLLDFKSIPFLICIAIYVWRWRNLLHGWKKWENGRATQVFVFTVCFVLAWAYSTYDYNYFFGSWHGIDRLLLLVLLIGVWRQPVFALPFLLIVIPLIGQFEFPIGGFSWAVPYMAIHLLILFVVCFTMSLVTGKFRSQSFLFLVCCMVASHYWPSGYTKFKSGWLLHDQLAFLLPNCYANGWLSFLSTELIEKLTALLMGMSPILKLFSITAECAAPFFFMRRRFGMLLLIAWIIMHFGILAVTGICFWQWILIDTCLLFLLMKAKPFREKAMFSLASFCIAFCIIGTSKWWLKPVNLTWFDGRATYTYRFYGLTETGQTVHLPPQYFEPYGRQFTVGGFQYLVNDLSLGITWGGTSHFTSDKLQAATSSEEIILLEHEIGRNFFNRKRTDEFVLFLKRFVGAVNINPGRKFAFRLIQPPRLIWTYGEDDAYRYDQIIEEVRVVQVLSFFDDKRYWEIRERPILTIKIPSSME